MCGQLFTPEQRKLLVGEWGRDTLDLTPDQYSSRVQVYKRLDKIWGSPNIQNHHPDCSQGATWGQHNTLLIDDSVIKACAQPYNHIEIPEFVKGGGIEKRAGPRVILAQVVGYLEEARNWSDVSAFVRGRKFEINKGWRWDWKQPQKHVEDATKECIDLTVSDDEPDEGGVKI